MSAGRPIRIGTRGSALAIVQANLVAAALDEAGVAHEIVIVETAGDRRAPDTAWGEGAFVAAIERALVEGRVDVAVHSAKDVPTAEDRRLSIAAYLPRVDPRDALVLPAGSGRAGLADLPAGSRIGTDSPRRTGFLRARRPDLAFRPLHGNVDTRLRKLDAGEADALVLAVAGLIRLGRGQRVSEPLPTDVVPPAPGQGAIAVQVRADDEATAAAIAPLDDRPTRLAVEGERAFLRAAGGGCRAPIGAIATVDGARVRLLGGLAAPDGTTAFDWVEVPIGEAEAAAAGLAARLARRLRAGRRADAAPAHRRRVLVTRPAGQAASLVVSLGRHGIDALVVPAIAVEPVGDGAFEAALEALRDASWAVVTSANGARAVLDQAARRGADLGGVRWAAIGDATAAVLETAGMRGVWQPPEARGGSIGEALPIEPGQRVVLLRGSLADGTLSEVLRRRGAEVREAVVYRTIPAPASSRARLADAFEGRAPDAVLFTSASAVGGLLALAGEERRAAVLGLPAICIGPGTAMAASEAGFGVLGQGEDRSSDSLAALTARLLGARLLGAPTGGSS